ncbi:MAG: hypothetical protein ACR2PH_08605 [Desulfobulbia bacterium]
MDNENVFDNEVRHIIYTTFKEEAKPPTTEDVAILLKKDIASIEKSFVRLADSHHIALAPGSYSIWMAHPFSALPTNYTAEIDLKKYYAN